MKRSFHTVGRTSEQASVPIPIFTISLQILAKMLKVKQNTCLKMHPYVIPTNAVFPV